MNNKKNEKNDFLIIGLKVRLENPVFGLKYKNNVPKKAYLETKLLNFKRCSFVPTKLPQI
jgi:hypothetical protein